jgi:hypothetical protein
MIRGKKCHRNPNAVCMSIWEGVKSDLQKWWRTEPAAVDKGGLTVGDALLAFLVDKFHANEDHVG